MYKSILTIKPIQQLPEILFYNPKYSNCYRMLNTKNSKYIGEMVAYPYGKIKDEDLYIKSINILPEYRKQGFGTKFLDFAQSLSKQFGFNGKLSATATTLITDYRNPPHLFLRKYGFGAEDSATNRKFDKLISKGVQLKKKESYACNMFYPTKPLEPTFLELCISNIKKNFKK